MSELDNSLQFLGGVGPKRAELLKKELGIETLSDLIHFYPFRYIDRSRILKIAQIDSDAASIQVCGRIIRSTLYGPASSVLCTQMLQDGKVVTQTAQVRHTGATSGLDSQTIRFNMAKRLSVIVDDGTGSIEMVFFKGIKWNWTRLSPGLSFVFFGKPQAFNGRYNMVHPEVDPVQEGSGAQPALTGVYPSTEKLKNSGVTGKVMCRMVSSALSLCLPEVQENLPDYIIKDNALVSHAYALKNIHFPSDSYTLEKAVRRLKFEELFFLQLSLLKQKYVRSRSDCGILMPHVGPDFHACFNALPYSLTGAQQRVIKEIRADLVSGHQMNRLLQGDVGSGKTMVAVLSCLIAIGNGCQACIIAPTEVLARQHFINISRYLEPTQVRCEILTGNSTARERRAIDSGLRDGSIGILVGTHAILEDTVVFKNLGFAVIDEQHRFGVDQRSKLWAKGADPCVPPHILVMTATPIPRTLAMTLYGDLDVSVLDEMPPGRKSVQTMLITENKRAAMYKFIRDQIALGRQAFIVYPMIFENDKMDISNLEQGYEEVVKRFPLPDYKVAIVHGQQTPEYKNFNMDAFVAGRAQILVSTTVIEVGVDVPNASVMVIESAQRFGLSQLHQLRGRVGRGAEKSYCILVRDPKTSAEGIKRLEIMTSTEDGFLIAEEDMKMRGPGDLEGTQQSGLPIKLNIASLATDGRLLGEARAYADRVLADDPTLSDIKNAKLAKELRKEKYSVKDYSRIS